MPVVVVTGAPATGKTGLASFLAQELALVLVSKDEIKERLFDAFGLDNERYNKPYGVASVELLFLFADKLVAAGVPVVLESNFEVVHAEAYLRRLADRHAVRILEVRVETEPDALFARFAARSASAERHPGHGDATMDRAAFRAYLAGRTYGVGDVAHQSLVVDTTHGFDEARATLRRVTAEFLAQG